MSTAIKGERNLTVARLNLIEPPPETAIEATPETTPFVTPVKASGFTIGMLLCYLQHFSVVIIWVYVDFCVCYERYVTQGCS